MATKFRRRSRRWSGWRLDANHVVCYEPDAGVLFCESAVRGYRQLAMHARAQMHPNTTIARLEVATNERVVATAATGEHYEARHAIVCAAKSSSALLHELGIDIPVIRLRKTFAWFDSDPIRFGKQAFPGFSMSSEVGQFYGFPDVEGAGLKIGRHDGGQRLRVANTSHPRIWSR
ncbi:FAD-dependent oxidoreductase [Burkholderia metallica]|uniref:FAD-dependent oxidoreductase n=1 Tax=Burkholderia metallica TaxID=488729 RepID=UPI00384C3C97